MKTIEKNDIELFKNALVTYYAFKKEEQKKLKEAFYIDECMKDEMKGSGISYESIGSGCSVTFPAHSYLEQLSIEKATYEIEAKRCHYVWIALDKSLRIRDKLSAVDEKYRRIITDVYRDKASITSLADKIGISRQAYTERIENAFKALLEVEV